MQTHLTEIPAAAPAGCPHLTNGPRVKFEVPARLADAPRVRLARQFLTWLLDPPPLLTLPPAPIRVVARPAGRVDPFAPEAGELDAIRVRGAIQLVDPARFGGGMPPLLDAYVVVVGLGVRARDATHLRTCGPTAALAYAFAQLSAFYATAGTTPARAAANAHALLPVLDRARLFERHALAAPASALQAAFAAANPDAFADPTLLPRATKPGRRTPPHRGREFQGTHSVGPATSRAPRDWLDD